MAAPRKVLYIMGRGTLGGVERHVQALIRNLDRTMFVPHVAILMDGGSVEDELRASGVPVFVLGGNSGWDPKLAWRLHRVIREARTDLVHSHELHGAVGAALRASPSRCWIHTEHCSFERGPSPRRAALLWKLFGGRMNRIICVSQATADGLCRNTGIKPGRIATVFNGVDIETLPPKNPNYLRDELHVEASAPILGLVGRLAWQKGIDDFLEFATRAAKKITAARFVIAGDGPERDALQSKAAALNLAGRCFFLGNRPDGAAIIGGLDMFLMTSRHEELPTTLLEAFAQKTSVAGYLPEGGVREILSLAPRPPAILIENRDPEALAAQAFQILNDPRSRDAMVNAAFTLVSETFSMRSITRKLEAIYTDALDAQRAA